MEKSLSGRSENGEDPADTAARRLVKSMSRDEKLSQLSYAAAAVPRLGVPAYNWWSEALHGVARAGKATVFPQAIGMAACFDPDLIRTVAGAIATEGRAKHAAVLRRQGFTERYQGLTFWTPNVNILRDPRWGRGQETYGEDPVLTGLLGAAFVQGLQWGIDDPNGSTTSHRSLLAAACAKHFAVHSGPESGRHHFDARVSPKDLFETYLPAFERLVDAGVEAVMGAYNRVNGEPCCGSPFLLQDVLRDRWGFAGHVVSDCWAIRDFHDGHGVTATAEESVALAVNSGCDLNCGDSYALLPGVLERGLVSEARIDEMATRLLATRYRLGLLPPTEFSPPMVPWDRHAKLAQTVAERSMVLLLNRDSVLPLDQRELRSLYVTGPFANDLDVLLGNYYGTPSRTQSFLAGLSDRAGMDVKVEYRPGCLFDRGNANDVQWALGEAADADAVVAVLGNHPLVEGEEGDAIASATRGDRERVELPAVQLAFLRELRRRSSRLIVVLTGGGAFALPDIETLCDAVLVAWYPGQAGGNALAGLLFGDVSPQGKLPVSFPHATTDLPPFDDYSMQGRTYRYAAHHRFPFGFGLTYGGVELGSPGISMEDDGEPSAEAERELPAEYFAYRGGAARHRDRPSPFEGDRPQMRVTLPVRNPGLREVEETVQLYLRWPELPGTPRWQLVAMNRVAVPAGGVQNLAVMVPLWNASVVDEQGIRFLPQGRLELFIGTSSPGGEALGAASPQRLHLRLTARR